VGQDPETNRQPRQLGRGFFTSLLIHSGLLFPLITLAFVLGAKEEAERAEQVEMSFNEVDPTTLPEDLPPIDPSKPEPPRPKKEALALKAEPPVQPEPKPQDEPPPPKPEPKPEQQPPPPKPQPQPEKQNKKSVDVEVEKEDEPDLNAQFLAEKSHRAKEETRAERTNLEKATKGEKESSSPSDRKDQNEGDKENKIAQTEDVASKAGRSAPNVTPKLHESLAEAPNKPRDSLLSMRNQVKRQHEVSPETSMAELPRDPNGEVPMPPDHLESMKDLEGRDGPSARPSLRLSAKQYEYLFGDDKDAAAALAKKQSSKKMGRFGQHLARIQSALENFVPEVRPGNQTELNTRAAPFAAFIARMHRSIHELWGFGFLEELDARPSSDPLNNRSLMTQLEIVLAGDGTVDKVTIIKPSGELRFDVSAIDTVYNAGPYPEPPPAIRSRNGKIYVHWSFHRDERQCATSGVDYYILDNPPADRPNDAMSSAPPPRPVGSPGTRSAGRSSGGGGARPNGGGTREADDDRPGELPEPDMPASRRASAQLPNPDNPAARRLAEEWFAALVAGDVPRMVRDAVFPFRTAGAGSATSASALSRMLRDLLADEPLVRPTARVELMTAAGLRAAGASVPAPFGDGAGLLFAMARIGKNVFVLALSEPAGQGTGHWKARGLVRL
jgi:TonB family protein